MALEILRAESVSQAAGTLAGDDRAHFLAGGTFLVRAVTTGDGAIRKLVLADGLGLDRIALGDTVTIGSAVTMAEVAREPRLAYLAPVAESIGGPAVRNMATVGGNLFARSPYGDFTVALLALGAAVVSETLDGEEIADLEVFLRDGPKRGGIVRSVRFTAPPAGAFSYLKVTRKHPHGASVLSIAALLPKTADKATGVRVAYGAMAPRPMRARAVEAALEGKVLDAAAINAAAEVAAEGTAPEDDPQASAWYRRTVLPVHLRRLLSGDAH
ncbi:MAG TPA: FAD binding domain-containing protein [Bauldia sp.]|nr:FAD binding domain-containing protein [Bauldia sp.]